MRSVADATRLAARQLGEEAGHNEIVAWSHEMSAWFALTQGRYRNVVDAAEAGQNADTIHSVRVQLLAQQAKALGRMGDVDGVRRSLELGGQILSSMPRPDRPEHHFLVDPNKWNFYAMDAYRLAGDDERAREYAHEVLAKGKGENGTELAPMRMAEARLTLGVVAARSGELDEASTNSLSALEFGRRSMPSLLMIARELDTEMRERFPSEQATWEFRDRLRSLRT
ncbi:hypothetical protein K1W54_27245 [Micromonospora sp. CPCC 205371]|nr:hypothetical protein [Micromonospora sp. CPCC 205371]